MGWDPRLIEFKGLCTFDQRQIKGVNETFAEEYTAVENSAPADGGLVHAPATVAKTPAHYMASTGILNLKLLWLFCWKVRKKYLRIDLMIFTD